MKKSALKLISALLCLVMLTGTLGLFSTAVGETYPNVYVPGFLSCPLYENPGTDEEKIIFPPENPELINTVALALPVLGVYASQKDWDGLCDKLFPLVNDMLSVSYCDDSGNPKPNTGVDWEYPSAEKVRSSASTDFYYDWRLSPVDLADQLAAYIDYVKECTGSDKVTISCHSYGSSVTMAYASKYSTASIYGISCNSPAFFGANYIGQLLTGNLHIDGTALVNYLKDNVFWGTENEEALASLLDLLEIMFAAEKISDNANFVVSKIGARLMKEVLAPWFLRWPSIWAMLPDSFNEDAHSFVFENMLVDGDYSALQAKIAQYDAIVKDGKRYELLENVTSGINFGIIAKYNKQEAPVSGKADTLSDNTIDLQHSSFGATAVSYGSTFPGSYEQKKYPETNYISPDRMIDASTCLYPENTWFVKDLTHQRYCDGMKELEGLIVNTPGFNVRSDSAYPQFMVCDKATDSLVPLTAETENDLGTFASLFNLLRGLRDLLIKLLTMLGVM